PEALANQWKIGEETAARHGKTMDRKNWKLVVNVHVAEDDEEALRQVKRAERHETITYFEETLGRPPGRSDDPLTEGVKMGTTLVRERRTRRARGLQAAHVRRPRRAFARHDALTVRSRRRSSASSDPRRRASATPRRSRRCAGRGAAPAGSRSSIWKAARDCRAA